MGDILKKAKVPLIIILLLVLGFFVYNSVFKKDVSEEGLAWDVEGGVVAPAPNENFLPLLNLIKGVDFDEKFFEDPVFRSMVDFSEPIREEEKGRSNPFAPGILSSFTTVGGQGVVFEASVTETSTSTPTGPRTTGAPTATTTRP